MLRATRTTGRQYYQLATIVLCCCCCCLWLHHPNGMIVAAQQQQQQPASSHHHLQAAPVDASLVGRQLVDVPFGVSSAPSSNNGTSNSQTFPGAIDNPNLATTNFYMNSQVQKFRVNVSNVCEPNQMRVTVRLSRPFYGLIHAKDKRRKPACFVEGTGEQSYTLDISYTLLQWEPNYCGVVSHQLNAASAMSAAATTTSRQQQQHQAHNQSSQPNQHAQQTLSLVLVVRLHKSIEFSDDRYFLLSCANRCSRPNCSTPSSSSISSSARQQLQLHNGTLRSPAAAGQTTFTRGLATSESVISPILRPTTGGDSIGAGAAKLVEPLIGWATATAAATGTTTANGVAARSCDVMRDLKFQWIARLCWILSALLLATFCTASYLCIVLSGRKRRRREQPQRVRRSTTNDFFGLNKSGRPSSGNGNKQQPNSIVYTPAPHSNPAESLSWSAAATTATTTNSSAATRASATTTNDQEELEKIRDDNSFLAKQHQQLVLANLMANKNNSALSALEQEFTSVAGAATAQPLVLGRSQDTFGAGSGVQRGRANQLAHSAQVRRRRSIGGSIVGSGPEFTTSAHQHGHHRRSHQPHQQHEMPPMAQCDSDGRFDAGLRAKSRSQTTIHYEQTQDPFKAVPFSYLNNGYLSDSNSPPAHIYHHGSSVTTNLLASTANDHEMPSQGSYHASVQNLPLIERMGARSMAPDARPQSMLINGNSSATNKGAEGAQAWSNNFRPKQTDNEMSSSSSSNHHHTIGQQAQQQLSSQFDPQNSRQLIDLIQQKHRHQIAQANRTAAGMQPSQLFAELQRQPILGNQQRVNMPPLAQTVRVWR